MPLLFDTIDDAVHGSPPTAVAPLKWSPINHVLSRFAFGPSVASRGSVDHAGVQAWYTAQVALAKSRPGYAAGPSGIRSAAPYLKLSIPDLTVTMINKGQQYGWDAMDQLGGATIALQIWSPAQLYETLVDFFSNHLNVPNHNGDVWNSRVAYDRDVIRAHATGSFTDMLLASGRHPAMLRFLNLADSTAAAINENYGRELLELHTVGLNYTEADVRNVAKMLTGRIVGPDEQYFYDQIIHPTGKVTVLGFTHPNKSRLDGDAGGDQLLTYLAQHPFTATHLATKLCIRFVSDTPSSALIAAVAQAYLDNGTQILPMIETILRSQEFWQSRGAKIRRPSENLVATVRILGSQVSSWPNALNTLSWMTESLGDRPLDWQAPNGYPDVAAAWRNAGSMLQCWYLQLGFASGWPDGFAPLDNTTLYGGTPATSGAAIDALTKRLTGMTFSTSHRSALQGFLAEPSTTPLANSVLQWNLEPLVALILHGPHHALR
ncbi:DUF1800 domain-containing protein [Jatrophihabitans sp.]|uniref:DUF1800 domain-containing protein n=1 Tax=Jatrophihabitans sp. TaxID=1932789 RepID=UPI0030C75CC7|nr:hypothetical protein [Jatrophihabitans sp.]